METELHETFSRIRSIRRAGRKGAFRIARRDQAARSGIPKALRCESAQARAEAEGQALRLGPRGSVALDGFRLFLLHLAGDRKSTRLNSSHLGISYAVFCL